MSLFILDLSVSLLTISLHPKSFININVKRLRISTPTIPYCLTPVFMPTYTPIKGSYSHQPSLRGPIDTNPNPKDKV
jgi:hypothetical protein